MTSIVLKAPLNPTNQSTITDSQLLLLDPLLWPLPAWKCMLYEYLGFCLWRVLMWGRHVHCWVWTTWVLCSLLSSALWRLNRHHSRVVHWSVLNLFRCDPTCFGCHGLSCFHSIV